MCIYCGTQAASTRDHIPPKCLFPGAREDLLTVPACTHCNNGASHDDEYFRLFLTANENAVHGEILERALAAVGRSLERTEARGLLESIVDSLRQVEVFSREGLYLGDTEGLVIDRERVTRVVERVTRGLYYHETGTPLSPDAEVSVAFTWGFPGVSDEAIAKFAEAAAMLPRLKTLADGQFKYGGLCVPNSRDSGWMMEFYRGIGFMARTGTGT